MKCTLSLAGLILTGATAVAFPTLPTPADVTARLQKHIKALSSETDAERQQAITAIHNLGPWGRPAFPTLIAMLPDSSVDVVYSIANLLSEHPIAAKDALPALMQIIRRPRLQPSLANNVAIAIAELGDPSNPEVVRALLATDFEGRRGGSEAHSVIRRYPKAMLPVVADLLSDPNSFVQSRAALNLYRLAYSNGPNKQSLSVEISDNDRKSIADKLRPWMDHPSPQIRNWIVPVVLNFDRSALREVIPRFLTMVRRHENYAASQSALALRGSEAAAQLLDSLDDPSPDVRREVAVTLSRCGNGAMIVLAGGLRHPNPAVRSGVLETLALNFECGKALRNRIIARLSDEDTEVRLTAATTLVANGTVVALPAIPVLTEEALSRSATHRMRALAALQLMGPTARPTLPTLTLCARSGDLSTRFAAARALAAIDKSTWRTYVPVCIDVLANDVQQQHSAIRLLSETGPNAKDALPALRKQFASDRPMIAMQAAEAVVRIAPNDAEDAVGCLAKVVTGDGGGRTRRDMRQAIRALQRIGAPARSAVPALLELVRNDSDTDTSVPAAIAVIQIDPTNAGEAYDGFRNQLQPGLADPDSDWLDGILQLGKAAKPLVPDLVVALKGRSSYQRMMAVDALTMLGPEAKQALPALKAMQKEKLANDITEVIKAIEGKK